jgi:hypothetical protein
MSLPIISLLLENGGTIPMLTLLFLLLQVYLELMRTSLSTLEVTSPLDHDMEAVLPGVHTRLSSLHNEMVMGFAQLATWQQSVDSSIQQSALQGSHMVRQSQETAAQLVSIASKMIGWGGSGMGAGGGTGQASPAPLLNSQQRATDDAVDLPRGTR